MASTSKSTETSATATEIPMTLEEFCGRLSSTDRRVELLGGFYHSEKRAGNIRDIESNYATRYALFANAPVQNSNS